MNRIAKNISVDSGMILISDKSFYDNYHGVINREDLCKRFKIKNGNYKVFWHILDTWNGDVEGDGILTVNSEELIVSDPCYHIQGESNSEWERVLKETNYFNDKVDGCVVLDKMGGDGCFDIHLNLELIEE